MTGAARPLDHAWKARFDLSDREAPDLFERVEDVRDTPHAGAIRATLEDLGASAVFCVQGVPTIVFVDTDAYDRAAIVALHAALWNQGLASILLVLCADTVRAFSLARKPYRDADSDFDARCLVQTLNATADALELKSIISGAESGRLWEEHSEYFRPKERIDQVLLENLTSAYDALCDLELSSDEAQALLIQAMFIAYLEDREITGQDYFEAASGGRGSSFAAVLDAGNVTVLKNVFSALRRDFNGDLFVAPCSFEANTRPPALNQNHLAVLARFRSGREEMARSGQLRFWGYDFKRIPIELISAVYDRFLGEREAERRDTGAYYTPMFLADTVISQVWDTLPAATKEKGDFVDPACGSGVFLVRSFQRMCEHWRETRTAQRIRWDSLKNILDRLHGWDLNGAAVRVAVFSLYVALLEEVTPPDIRKLIEGGRVLPELWGKTLKCQDFFAVDARAAKFDVVIGNPPWASRRNSDRTSVAWCDTENLPMPQNEDAWAFTWKALRHLRAEGILAFLLPAMGFLHNHAENTVAARKLLISTTRIRRIVNFADLRFQLFDGADRPAALIVLSAGASDQPPYRFEYWAPKADLNLKVKRLITLSSVDKSFVTSKAVTESPLVFKQRLWMREPDANLFKYLEAMPKVGAIVREFSKAGDDPAQWLIGQGYQPHHSGRYTMSEYVSHVPDLPIANFRPLAQPTRGLKAWASSRVRRKGFERGFEGPRILIPRGVKTATMRLRASFIERPLTFQHIIQAIVVPKGDERRAKLLTALLNSKVAVWYAFHGTASFGSDRPEVQQAELMRLPFPAPQDLPDPERAKKAERTLVSIVDKAISEQANFGFDADIDDALRKLDQCAYDYFCLSVKEVILIEDAVNCIFPAVQPNAGSFPSIWRPAAAPQRKAYVETLVGGLSAWMKNKQSVEVALEAHNADLALLRLSLVSQKPALAYQEKDEPALREALARVFGKIHHKLPGNFQLMPDLRIFDGDNLYLVKPMQTRFWLRSAALADAGAIALDLQDFVATPRKQGQA
ncbi:MAG: N-6 DNA methylase [Hyphomonadaceae bacterium JAD_PAG50586_4]|nr:MAG: N-6 DNA methylase [Hyphomonadaceae bacterium JAD_PAG50586_4]